MSGFTKLVPEIVESSLWNESSDVRIVWITMLAKKDADGYVRGDAKTLARLANVPLVACEEALTKFQQPDESSHTPDNEGRRIAPAPGGWIVLNSDIYRASDDVTRAKTRERVRRFRENASKSSCNVTSNVTETLPSASVSASVSVEGESEGKTPEPTAEEIYYAYPLKVGKPAALRAIEKAVRKHGAAHVLERTQRYAVERGKGTPFTPHPSTWFNQERYNDDPSTWTRDDAAKPPSRNDGTYNANAGEIYANQAI